MDRETTIEYMRKAVACHNENPTACLGRNCCDCPYDYPLDTIEFIESALELLEQDRWIPMTERLPELESEVLVTDEYGEIRHADYSDWFGKAEFRTVEESMTLEDVKAWRPLPAPYQEEEDEEQKSGI